MLLYNLVVRSYGLLIKTVAFRKIKAAQWVEGRKNWRQKLQQQLRNAGPGRVAWIHCASYGEFEQGRPLIEKFRKLYPDHRIVLSFFSPSGYEAFKNWPGADVICYLPLDTKRNAGDFVDLIQPSVAIFIKYEFWVNYLFALKRKNVPVFLVSAVFKQHHPFFKWYGSLFRRSLATFKKLFIQDEASGVLLAKIGINHFEVCGDTRFDRVLEIKKNFKPIPEIAQFKGNNTLLVAGSTWPKDDDLVIAAYSQINNPELKLLLVPHDVEEKFVETVCEKLAAAGLSYSRFTKGIDNQARVLVLDTMGMLSRSYYYGDLAYIGGGFNGGIHNSLEAAVFDVPVVFYGDTHGKFNEAVELINMQAAFNVMNVQELVDIIRELTGNSEHRKHIRHQLHSYFGARSNSSDAILDSIRKCLAE